MPETIRNSNDKKKSKSKKVIVFGSTGAIGRHLIELLAKEQPTWEVMAVTRSQTTDKFDHLITNNNNKKAVVKVVQGDPNIREQVVALSADQDIIYSCIGFSRYEAKYWAQHWPLVVDNLLVASNQRPAGQQQKLVFCDNLYAYGPTTNISPRSATVPPSNKSKPGVRAMIRQKFEQRIAEQPDSIVIVGGADFFGPYVTNVSFLGDTFTKPIVEGGNKTAPLCIGSASVIHDFAYAPDFARALYIASINDDKASGKFWVCPHAVRNKTMNDIAADVARLAAASTNKNSTKVTVYPGWSIRLLSPFMGFMYEMVEMLPFWSKDYTVDDSDFCNTFGVQPTPYEEALGEYVKFYQGILSAQKK